MFQRLLTKKQETHHEMKIPKRDVTYIVLCLLTYAYP